MTPPESTNPSRKALDWAVRVRRSAGKRYSCCVIVPTSGDTSVPHDND
jgi:hypothetical protein